MLKPKIKPQNPYFSSGPCTKHPGWKLSELKNALLSRSHRSLDGKARLKELIDLSTELLELPKGYKVALLPGSDMSAFCAGLWNMLGERPVETLVWENFGLLWDKEITQHLGMRERVCHSAPYGQLPDLRQVNFNNDVVFCWNGTTSGVKMPNADAIPGDRKGLTFCDATSAVFAMEVDFLKLDVISYSWQKALGGEAQHGMLILSPRAIQRLESYTPTWPIPKVFRLSYQNKLIEGLFRGETLNTPSMLCVEDIIQSMRWVKNKGGIHAMIQRSYKNYNVLASWIEASLWCKFMVDIDSIRSNSSMSFQIIDPIFIALSKKEQWNFIIKLTKLLEEENIAYDIKNHEAAPPSIRIWTGCMIEEKDLEDLTPWLDWAFSKTKKHLLECASWPND